MKPEYFSKWRNCWVEFPRMPTKGELMKLKQFHYQVRLIYVGIFKDIKDAARAYNAAAIKYHGEFAVLNEVL